MDAKYFAEIKAREQAATPGPWIAESYYPEHIPEPVPRFRRVKNDDTDIVNDLSFSFQRPDAAFIAHARADIPALLAEVERLTQARNYLQQLYDKLHERNENRSKQSDSLKKALEFALDDLLDAATTPCSYCRNNPSNGGNCDMNNGHHEMFSCWIWQGVDPHQAQKQEAEK